MADRPRRASIARRLLSRARRVQDGGGARLAASVVARRRSTAHALVPRLLPQRETRGSASVSPARQSDPPTAPTSEPAAAAPEGMSEFAAEWLFGEGDVRGVPFAGGAALPVSGRPAFLSAPSVPAPATAARAPRSGVRPRGRVQEGPVRLSSIPPAPAAPAPDPGSSGAARAASEPVPPTDPASAIDPARSGRPPAIDPASSGRLSAIDPASSVPPTGDDPAPATVFTPPLGAPSGPTDALPGAAPPAPADSSGAPSAIPPPAAKAPPVPLAPKRLGEPASTPPPRPPVALRRVARSSASLAPPLAMAATVPASPPRGLLRRALDRMLPGRRTEQTGAAPAGAWQTGPSASTPSAGGGSGAARVGARSGRSAGAGVARTPAARPDVPPSRRADLPPVGSAAPTDRRVAPLLHEPPRNPDTSLDSTPPARTAPPPGARVDRASAEGAGALPAPSQPEIPVASASDFSPAERAPAPNRGVPTLARVLRPAGGTGSGTPSQGPVGALPTRSGGPGASRTPASREPPGASTSPAGAREPSADGVSTSTGASGPSAPAAGRDVRASGATGPGGLRRALARLRTDRSPQPPPQEAFASELPTGSGSIEGAPAESPADEPTGHDLHSVPWLSPTPAVDGPTPQPPPAPGAARGSVPAPAALPAPPGIARAASGESVRPPVRLRRVPARIFSPQLASSASARLAPRSRPGAPTTGERLADATGAPLHRELAGGRETIEFFPGDSDASPSVLARAPAGAPAPSPAAPAAEAQAPPGAPVAEGGGAMSGGASASHAGASPEADDMYEHIIERLRRDLLTERERMGDLLGDLP
jgi:hypothetical protein